MPQGTGLAIDTSNTHSGFQAIRLSTAPHQGIQDLRYIIAHEHGACLCASFDGEGEISVDAVWLSG